MVGEANRESCLSTNMSTTPLRFLTPSMKFEIPWTGRATASEMSWALSRILFTLERVFLASWRIINTWIPTARSRPVRIETTVKRRTWTGSMY